MSVPSNRFSEKDLEAATGGVLLKKGDLRNFIEKESLAQVFSCEFKKKIKNTFFTEHLWLIFCCGNLILHERYTIADLN